MPRTKPIPPLHPLEAFRARRTWLQRRTAKHFHVPYGRYRQIVTGHGGVSFGAAQKWAKRSAGEFGAMDVLLWHQKHQDFHVKVAA